MSTGRADNLSPSDRARVRAWLHETPDDDKWFHHRVFAEVLGKSLDEVRAGAGDGWPLTQEQYDRLQAMHAEAARLHAEERAAEGDYLGALWRANKADRLGLAFDWFHGGRIDKDELRSVLPDLWLGAEFPGRTQSRWLDLFEIAGYVSDTEERLSGRLAIYRGVQSARYARGMAWTLDRERGEWFARRFAVLGGTPRLYTVEIEAESILAYITGREENEVVIDPRPLPRLRGVVLEAESEAEGGRAY